MVVIDTNIVIDHLRQPPGALTALRKIVAALPAEEELSLSVVSIQELFEGKSTLNPQKEAELLNTIAPLEILAYDFEIARLAGALARDSKTPLALADAAIAATAILSDASLATLNTKDFIGLSRLKLYKFK